MMVKTRLGGSHSASSETRAVLLTNVSDEHYRDPCICRPWKALMRFRLKKIITVEPVMFLYMFGLYLFSFISQQYIFNRLGREKYDDIANYTGPFDFCITTAKLDNLSNGTADEVEEEASILNLVIAITSQLPAIFAALLYGPISDRIGRKPIICIIASFECITAIFAIIIIDFNLQIYYLIPLWTINGLAGSFPGIIVATYSYIADISSNKWLTVRIGILEAMIFIGGSLSLGINGVWLNKTGCNFLQPMFLYLACSVGIILYTIFILPESLTRKERRMKMKNRQSGGFKVIARGFKILFSKVYSRWRLWFGLVIVALFYVVALGQADISTLFLLHKPLAWGPALIGIYQSMTQAINMITLLVLLPVLVAFRLPDTLIMLIGTGFACGALVATSLVRTAWEMFVIAVIGSVQAITGPAMRSTLSKAVAAEDQGALFSIIATTSVLSTVVAAVVVFFFYPVTLELGWAAGTVYFLIAVISLIPVPFIITLLVFRNRPGAVYREEPDAPPEPPLNRDLQVNDHEPDEQDSLLSGSGSNYSSTAGDDTEKTPTINC